MKEEHEHFQREATDSLVQIMSELSGLGIECGLSSLSDQPDDLRLTLTPARPSTVMRHVRMWRRFLPFIRLDLSTFAGDVLGPPRVLRWLKALMETSKGVTTPSTALSMIRYLSHCFDFPDPENQSNG